MVADSLVPDGPPDPVHFCSGITAELKGSIGGGRGGVAGVRLALSTKRRPGAWGTSVTRQSNPAGLGAGWKADYWRLCSDFRDKTATLWRRGGSR